MKKANHYIKQGSQKHSRDSKQLICLSKRRQMGGNFKQVEKYDVYRFEQLERVRDGKTEKLLL